MNFTELVYIQHGYYTYNYECLPIYSKYCFILPTNTNTLSNSIVLNIKITGNKYKTNSVKMIHMKQNNNLN